VYHARYLAFYERARTEMLRQLNISQQKYTQIKLIPKITNIDLNTFFNQIETPNDLEGVFNASGDIEVNTLSGNKLLENLKGNLSINVTNAKLNKININSIIQNAATKYTKDVSATENMKNYTEFSKISTDAYLNRVRFN
ncbi:AsmA family, partial [Gilliamella apicola SCGC AB-598-B02]